VTRSGIVLAGTVVLDIVHMIDHWPDEEQIAFIGDTIHAPGGPPHNAAAGLIKLGAPFPVTLIGVIGQDTHGDTFIEKAKLYGLDTAQVRRTSDAGTDVTHVMTSVKTGRRTFFVQPGANNTLTPDQLLPTDNSGKIYYVGSPVISRSLDASDGWRTILRDVRARGFKTAMELCPVPRDEQAMNVRPCLPLLDYFVINDSEAEAITDIAVTKNGKLDWNAAAAACQNLLDRGVNELAVIHHPDGGVARHKSGTTAIASSVNVPREDIAGTVGAGDAFYAGMLLGLHEEWPLADCLALANAAAATSLHSPTTSVSIRPRTECLAYAASQGLITANLDDDAPSSLGIT
jgi:sugar/nucleoside kinase (ribokinase family)